jgi:hypothetical protein
LPCEIAPVAQLVIRLPGRRSGDDAEVGIAGERDIAADVEGVETIEWRFGHVDFGELGRGIVRQVRDAPRNHCRRGQTQPHDPRGQNHPVDGNGTTFRFQKIMGRVHERFLQLDVLET